MTDHLLAWIYLRQVTEASSEDMLNLLWPDGWEHRTDPDAGVIDPRDVASRILHRDASLPTRVLEATANRYQTNPRRELEIAHSKGYRLITPSDDEWPRRLDQAFAHMVGSGADHDSAVRGLAAAPFALWVRGKGNVATLSEHTVTIVGTRELDAYGVTVSQTIARDLALAGYGIVSGGARGVDRVAHQAALDAGNSTIAVLACGLEVDYPKQNQALFSQIAEQGVIVSEYPLETRPARHRFLTRNRLVAALSRGTVVTQAGNRSGALNTLNWAEAMLKPTMAVPGSVTSAANQGCLNRIRDQRASLVASAEHVRELVETPSEYAVHMAENPEQPMLNFDASAGADAMSLTQMTVFDATGIRSDNTGQLSRIQQDTGLPVQLVMRTLKELQTLGFVHRDGDRWIKVRHPQD